VDEFGNQSAGWTFGADCDADHAQIRLVWKPSVNGTNYNVKRSTTSGGPYTTINTTSATNYTDSTVAIGPVYYYVVSAVDPFGESTNTAQASATLADPGYQLSPSPVSQVVTGGLSVNYTVAMTTNYHFNGTVTFGVSGVPAGATASFSPPSLSQAGSATLTIQTVSNIFTGTYPLTIAGTNGIFTITTNVTLTINGVVAVPGTLLWTASSADTNWSTALNWTNVNAGAYGPPGISNNVVFTNAGTTAIQGVPNNFLDSSLAILSLQYSQTNKFHTTQIAAGSVLTIATNLAVGTGTDLGTSGAVYAGVAGAGASLVVTNTNCVVNIRQGTATSSGPWSQRATLDLSGLDVLNMKANRVLVAADGGQLDRETGTLYLAKTKHHQSLRRCAGVGRGRQSEQRCGWER